MIGTALPNSPAAGAPVVRMCCHCKRVRAADGWRYADVPPACRVSHGICRPCFELHYPEFGPAPSED